MEDPVLCGGGRCGFVSDMGAGGLCVVPVADQAPVDSEERCSDGARRHEGDPAARRDNY